MECRLLGYEEEKLSQQRTGYYSTELPDTLSNLKLRTESGKGSERLSQAIGQHHPVMVSLAQDLLERQCGPPLRALCRGWRRRYLFIGYKYVPGGEGPLKCSGQDCDLMGDLLNDYLGIGDALEIEIIHK